MVVPCAVGQSETERRLDEDEAGVGACVALARLDVATNQRPLAMATTHADRLPGRLALVDAVPGAPVTTPRGTAAAALGRPQSGELLALDTDDRARDQSTSPRVTTARRTRLRHAELGTVPAPRTRTHARALISAVADCMSAILSHMVWPKCEFKMHL